MTSGSPATAAVIVPICPLCHTFDQTVTSDLLAAGASWVCVTCGQRWTAARLKTVAAYARYESPR